MAKVVLLLALIAALTFITLAVAKGPRYDLDSIDDLYDKWTKKHGSSSHGKSNVAHASSARLNSASEHSDPRKEQFRKNAALVNQLNDEAEAEDHDGLGARFSLDGPYATLSTEEFVQLRLSDVLPRPNHKRSMAAYESVLDLSNVPPRINWKAKGRVSKVKNQGACGSCWAFSTTGVIESAVAIAKKRRPKLLSEQQLVDCVPKTKACQGQWMGTAIDYIKNAGGIHTASSYKYHARKGKCRRFKGKIGARVKGYTQFPQQYLPILQHVGTVGPVSAVVDATLLQHYKTGVMRDAKRCGTEGNHAILIVGYGSARGMPYWIIKNSWGTKWGKGGYFLLARGNNNVCGINNFGVVPIL
jgi:C1A family cysteine protease